MRIYANAKINWTLDITAKLPNGYHQMDMLMQPITLHDVITLQKADSVSLTIEGNEALPVSDSNLCIKAFNALAPYLPPSAGVHIHLEKHIPTGAGLGGGSSDAAAVLYGLNLLYGLLLPQSTLCQIGLALGADIPFCLTGGLQRARGIGECLTPIPGGRSYPLLVIKPPQELSTGKVFAAFEMERRENRPGQEAFIKALNAGDLAGLRSASGNVLTPCSEALCPAIRKALDALNAHSAAFSAMSGSGNAVFGLFDSAQARSTAYAALSDEWLCYSADTTERSLEICTN